MYVVRPCRIRCDCESITISVRWFAVAADHKNCFHEEPMRGKACSWCQARPADQVVPVRGVTSRNAIRSPARGGGHRLTSVRERPTDSKARLPANSTPVHPRGTHERTLFRCFRELLGCPFPGTAPRKGGPWRDVPFLDECAIIDQTFVTVGASDGNKRSRIRCLGFAQCGNACGLLLPEATGRVPHSRRPPAPDMPTNS